MPVDLSPADFDALVDRALDGIPDEIARLVRNVVVLVEADAPEDDASSEPAPVQTKEAGKEAFSAADETAQCG